MATTMELKAPPATFEEAAWEGDFTYPTPVPTSCFLLPASCLEDASERKSAQRRKDTEGCEGRGLCLLLSHEACSLPACKAISQKNEEEGEGTSISLLCLRTAWWLCPTSEPLMLSYLRGGVCMQTYSAWASYKYRLLSTETMPSALSSTTSLGSSVPFIGEGRDGKVGSVLYSCCALLLPSYSA